MKPRLPFGASRRGIVIELGAHLRHPGAVGRRRVRVGERQKGDVVPPREVAHQVPRTELAALVERQEQTGAEPEDLHVVQSVPARLPTGAGQRSRVRRPRRRTEVLDAVAVDPGAVPEFEIEQAPEHVAALGACRLRGRRAAASTAAASKSPRSRARRSSSTSRTTPCQRGRATIARTALGNPFSGGAGWTAGSRSFAASRSTRLVVKPESFHSAGMVGDELHELVIEKRHAAFDRCRHAHLVLLHQQLDEICLDVGIEQPIEQRPRPARRARPVTRRRPVRAWRAAQAAANSSRCAQRDGREVVEERGLRRVLDGEERPAGSSGRRAGQRGDERSASQRRAASGITRYTPPARQLMSARGYLPYPASNSSLPSPVRTTVTCSRASAETK